MSARTCEECRFDGGWHYDENGNASRCQNYRMAEHAEHERKLSIEQGSDRDKAAEKIVHDAAELHLEFSANHILRQVEDAGLDGDRGVMGRAFTTGQRKGWIANTGRTEPSRKKSTHGKPVAIYRSLLRDGMRAREAS